MLYQLNLVSRCTIFTLYQYCILFLYLCYIKIIYASFVLCLVLFKVISKKELPFSLNSNLFVEHGPVNHQLQMSIKALSTDLGEPTQIKKSLWVVHCDVGLKAVMRALRRLIQDKLKETMKSSMRKNLTYEQLCQAIDHFIQGVLESQPDLLAIFTDEIRTQVRNIILLVINASGKEVPKFIDSSQALAMRKRDSKARHKYAQQQLKAVNSESEQVTENNPNVAQLSNYLQEMQMRFSELMYHKFKIPEFHTILNQPGFSEFSLIVASLRSQVIYVAEQAIRGNDQSELLSVKACREHCFDSIFCQKALDRYI